MPLSLGPLEAPSLRRHSCSRPALGILCSQALDVENMMAVDTDGTNITWKETQDHAKWALTRDSGHPYVCIADINRMTSQRSRGGGAFCFQNANLAGQLSNSIVKQHACRGSSTKGKHNHHLRGEQHFHNTTLY